MRARGVAEVAILEELARNESKHNSARSGPKWRGDVVVRAARQLLAVPPQRQIDTE